MNQEQLAQLTRDTQDSIRGKNNYDPHAGRGPRGYWPSAKPNDLPGKQYSHHDHVLEII